MKELSSAVTGNGQVSLPTEVRRALGVKEGDEVIFVLEEGQVRLRPGDSVIERMRGMFAGPWPAESAEELREAAERAIAEEAVERSGA